MTIQKPYDLSIRDKVIDTNEPFLLSWKTSGETSSSFSISIYKNNDSTLVYNLPRTYSYATSFHLPAGFVQNGQDYKLKLTVWNSNGDYATSDYVVFTASSTPIVTIDPIGTVGNHSYLFTAKYSQAENVPILKYKVNLYSSDKKIIQTTAEKISETLEHRFELMQNDTRYFVEFVVTSKNGLLASSGLVEFLVIYENPSKYFILSAENVPERASVKLQWFIRQVIGKTTIEPIFLNNSELDVRNGKVFFDEGYEITSDFTLKIWFRNLIADSQLIYLYGSNGYIQIKYKSFDNKFHVYKKVNESNYHYTSPTINGTNFYLCVQQIGGKIDILVQ